MGSSHNMGDLKLVTVSTEALKDKLNQIYDAMRARPRATTGNGLFEYLWDLKELALMEGRNSVQVPNTWLQELDEGCLAVPPEVRLGH